MIGCAASVIFCDGYRISRNNHRITRNFPCSFGLRPLFFTVSVTAERKRYRYEKKLRAVARKVIAGRSLVCGLGFE